MLSGMCSLDLDLTIVDGVRALNPKGGGPAGPFMSCPGKGLAGPSQVALARLVAGCGPACLLLLATLSTCLDVLCSCLLLLSSSASPSLAVGVAATVEA